MFTACCLFFISSSFSFWTYPRMSCDELIKIHRIFFVCMRFSRYVDDNEIIVKRFGLSLLCIWALKKQSFFRSRIFFEYPPRLMNPSLCMQACNAFLPQSAQLHDSLSNGDGEIRTLDPLLARQVLSQLSYTPKIMWQPPTLPCRLQQSTIGRLGLNRRVQDGNGCVP